MNESTPFYFLSEPAQRALANAGIRNKNDLAKWTSRELLKLHGVGKGTILKLIEHQYIKS